MFFIKPFFYVFIGGFLALLLLKLLSHWMINRSQAITGFVLFSS
jgi:hypothetical protein